MKFQISFLFLFIHSIFALGQNEDAIQKQIRNKTIAVIPVIFPDAKYTEALPSRSQLDSILFQGRIKQFFDEMSFGKFNYTGKVYDYITAPHDEIKADGTQFYTYNLIQSIDNFTVPNFDTTGVDVTIFVFISDYKTYGSGTHKIPTLSINNTIYKNLQSIEITLLSGRYTRSSDYPFNDHFTRVSTSFIGDPIKSGLSYFDLTFMHEFTHALGIQTHAQSRTNGDQPAYKPEVPHNANPQGKSYLNSNYGNIFSIMGGSGNVGHSMCAAYRILLGWADENNSVLMDNFGKQTHRIYPINSSNGVRMLEVRLPFQKGFHSTAKNKGYTIEVRDASFWDSTLIVPEVSENTKGVLVSQSDGFTSHLLDMSPSANLKIKDHDYFYPDKKDMVLKPGMKYNDGNIHISNVISHSDGSFSVDIDVIMKKSLHHPVQNLQVSSRSFSYSPYNFTWTIPSSKVQIGVSKFQYGSWNPPDTLNSQTGQASLPHGVYARAKEVRFRYIESESTYPSSYVYWSAEKGIYYTSIFESSQSSSSQLSSSLKASSSSLLLSSSKMSSSSATPLSSIGTSSSVILSSSKENSSSSNVVNCNTYSDWQFRSYNWVAIKEFVIYQNNLYSHTNWVNNTTPDKNPDWRFEGNCSETTNSSPSISSSFKSSSSSAILSSSKESSSSVLPLSSIGNNSSVILSSSKESSSSSNVVNCDTHLDWQFRSYDWVAIREFAIYQNRLYSHTNWVNNTSPDNNSDWRFEGNCSETTNSSPLMSSSSKMSSSSLLSLSSNGGSSSLVSSSSTGTNDCNSPNWVEGSTYLAGDKVLNAGKAYECKPWPYNSWCGLNSYEPGVGFAWQSAWEEGTSCRSSRVFVTQSDFQKITGLGIQYTSSIDNTIDIYSIHGKKIKAISLPKGSFFIPWNLEKGVYYLRSETHSLSKKIHILE